MTTCSADETPADLPVEVTSQIEVKVASSPLQRLRWMSVVGPLTGNRKECILVAAILAEMAGKGRCWPSLDTLAKRTLLKRAHVARGTKGLEDAGLVRRERRWNTSTVYLLTFPAYTQRPTTAL